MRQFLTLELCRRADVQRTASHPARWAGHEDFGWPWRGGESRRAIPVRNGAARVVEDHGMRGPRPERRSLMRSSGRGNCRGSYSRLFIQEIWLDRGARYLNSP